MLKTLLALSGAMLLAAPGLHAQGARSVNGGGAHEAAFSGGSHGYASRGYASRSYAGGRGYAYRGAYHGHYYGRYYFLGGVGYYYPYFGLGYGFGYPYYAYDGYWNGYAGAPFGYGEGGQDGAGVYEGRMANQDAPDEQNGGELPKAVQRQLAKRGYYKGKADGDFGASSRSALSHFQRDNHLKETGRIDEDSLEALGFSDHR